MHILNSELSFIKWLKGPSFESLAPNHQSDIKGIQNFLPGIAFFMEEINLLHGTSMSPYKQREH